MSQIDNDRPVVGEINSIYVIDETEVFLKISCYSTTFNAHYHVYELDNFINQLTIKIEDIYMPISLLIRTNNRVKCVCLPYAIIL